jgi:hypothetical protein
VNKYFKREAESELGDTGIAYMEITDRWPSRQVEIYGEVWRWGDRIHTEHLADKPFEDLGLTDEYAISSEEFERVWNEAQLRCPPPS